MASPINLSFKLNSDGACHTENDKYGFGGIIRDHSGNWLLGYLGSRPMGSILYMELAALQEGLRFALQYKYTPLEINVDSTEVISALLLNNYHYSSLINECRYLLHQLGSPRVTHVYREQNQVADLLAKHGTATPMQHPCTTLLEPPLFARAQYMEDQCGTLYTRPKTDPKLLGHTSFCLHMLSQTIPLDSMGNQQCFCIDVPQNAPCTTT